jgi:hypothetical protein
MTVFNGASPRVATALALAKDEAQLGFGWCQRPLLAHCQGLWLISGGLLVWFGQVHLLQACFGPDGDDGQVLALWDTCLSFGVRCVDHFVLSNV